MPAKTPLTAMPFAGTVADSVEMMRKVWGLTGLPAVPGTAQAAQFVAGLPGALPSMITPTLDLEELDKRIADLRAVEQWLNLNTQLLRTSIQTLEVQRNTIATLKSLGGSVLGGLRGGSAAVAAGTGPAVAGTAAAPSPADAFRAEIARPAGTAAEPAPAALAKRRTRATRPGGGGTSRAPAAAIAAAPLNPAVWWNALQDQFSKVAAAAAAGADAAARERGKRSAKKTKAAAGPGAGSARSTPADRAAAPAAPRARRR